MFVRWKKRQASNSRLEKSWLWQMRQETIDRKGNSLVSPSRRVVPQRGQVPAASREVPRQPRDGGFNRLLEQGQQSTGRVGGARLNQIWNRPGT